MMSFRIRKDWPGQLGNALRASWISILIVVLVMLLASLDQSDTIVVDLLDKNPVNFLLFVLLTLFLTQIVSHYPIYLEYNQNKRRLSHKSTFWKIHKLFLGFGFVTFKDKDFNSRSLLFGYIRNLWGLLLLAAIFYLLVTVHNRNVELPSNENPNLQMQKGLYVGWILTTYALMRWLLTGSRAQRLGPGPIRHYRRLLINTTLVLFLINLAIAVYFSATEGWSRSTYWCVYSLLLTAGPFYSATRFFRENTLLKKDLTFLVFIAVGGFLSIALLVVAHTYVFFFNPLVILLAQFIVIYGLVVIPVKHYFYYRQEKVSSSLSPLRRFFFVWLLPIYLPLLFLLALYAGNVGNDLHLLPTIEEQPESVVEFNRFVNDFDSAFAKKDTIYFIASFGGGLKANIWNQLIFERLSNYGGRNILNSTVAISGVSGGAIGHAVFGGMYKKYGPSDSTKLLRSEIRKLGYCNFVTLDLTYLLGKDLILELIPGCLYRGMGTTYDRAKRAMYEYSEFVNAGNGMLDRSYRAYWADLYRSEKTLGRFFPAFIANAAGTHIQRGIACSVKMEEEQFKSTFYNSTDLLSFTDSQGHQQLFSLPYLYAASCANRFPIFSPAAKVAQKGHFIDGGYFENSGMLSLLDFYESLKRKSELFQTGKNPPNVVFIQIINGREEYLKSLLADPYRTKIEEASELSSILGTVASISFVPSYLMAKNSLMEQTHSAGSHRDSAGVHYAQIHLPYSVTKRDMKELLKLNRIKLDAETERNMERSNAMIKRMTNSNWYNYVQPPLARLLGKQAVAYMDSALNQRATWKDLNRILNIPPSPLRPRSKCPVRKHPTNDIQLSSQLLRCSSIHKVERQSNHHE